MAPERGVLKIHNCQSLSKIKFEEMSLHFKSQLFASLPSVTVGQQLQADEALSSTNAFFACVY